MISAPEKEFFYALFIRNGEVLDFDEARFNNFSQDSINIALCKKYGLSTGNSLRKFVQQGELKKVIKLLDNLLQYYIKFCSEEIENEMTFYSKVSSNSLIGSSYSSLYKDCRKIIDREKEKAQPFSSISNNLKNKFDSDYINAEIDLMIEMCPKNPTEAIGKAKEIIESCCKSILEAKNKEANNEKFDLNVKMPKLVKETLEAINVPNKSIEMDPREEEIINQITGSLNGLISGIVELRNRYGSGHGRVKSFQALSTRHAELAAGSCLTLVRYLHDTYAEMKEIDS